MNILLICGLFMMGLLSSTDWFRLMPDNEPREVHKEKCIMNHACKKENGQVEKGACIQIRPGSEKELQHTKSIIGLLYLRSGNDTRTTTSVDMADLS
jgi:hypothetical protein